MDSPVCPPNKKYPIKIIHLDESKLNYAKDFKPTNKICYGFYLPSKVDLRVPYSYIPNSYIPSNFSLTSYFSKSNTSNNTTSNCNSPNKIMPPVYQQETLGSCTANALCAAMQFNNSNIQGSRLFVYYNERLVDNTTDEDGGAYLSDGIDVLKKYGVCQESEWPYDISKYTLEPTKSCYTNALEHKAIKVENISQDLFRMKKALWSGYPIILAIRIFNSFTSDYIKETGIVSMPDDNDILIGSHAILVAGYNDNMIIDDNKGYWICRNSHGANWGDNGYFYLPYKYLLDITLTTDLWIITEST